MDRSRDGAEGRPLHILCYLHATELGGVERAAVRLCDAWAQAARVTLALARGDAPARIDPRVHVRSAPRPPLSPSRWEALWMILWLPHVILRERPDVIFCAGNTYTVVAVALKLLLGRRCPSIVAKISNSLHRPDLPALIRELHALWCRLQGRVIDRFVGMTPEMTGEACEKLAVPFTRIVTIPSPLFDPAALAALAAIPLSRNHRDGAGRLLLAVGRLEPQKNLTLLLAAFAAGSGQDRLMIVGEGGQRARLEAMAVKLGVRDRVTLVGRCDDVLSWLRHADALVLSSDYEGVPAVVLEAMGAGLPVIATDCCASMAGLLADGRGVLVPRRDPAALAAALSTIPPTGHDPAAQRELARRHGVREAAADYLPLFRSLVRAGEDLHLFKEHAFS